MGRGLPLPVKGGNRGGRGEVLTLGRWACRVVGDTLPFPRAVKGGSRGGRGEVPTVGRREYMRRAASLRWMSVE